MRKIAFLYYGLGIGGASKSLINLLNFIDKETFEITLFIENKDGIRQNQLDSRVRVIFLGDVITSEYSKYIHDKLNERAIFAAAESVFYRFLSKIYVSDWYKNYKYYLKSYTRVLNEKYDVAIAFQGYERNHLMILDNFIKANKKAAWIHGECFHNLEDSYYHPFKRLYNNMDGLFCVSKAVQKTILDRYPFLDSKLQVLYNLQNIEEIIRLAHEPVHETFEGLTIVTVGRLSNEKGQDMIPEIAKILSDEEINYIWYIVGDGDNRISIQKKINSLNLRDRVFLLGTKINPYPYIMQCSLYVQPSYTEGFCLTTMEAKILGRKVVTTDVPGMREQFNDNEAIFCKATVESLANGILKGIDEQEKYYNQDNILTEDYNKQELQKLYDWIES